MCPVYADPKFAIEAKLNKIEDYLEKSDPKRPIYQKLGWDSIKDVLRNHRIQTLDDVYLQFLVKLSIKLAGIYYSQIRLRNNYFVRRKQLRNSKKTLNMYRDIISIIFSKGRSVDFNVLIESFERDHLWIYEQLCIKVTEIYVQVSKKNEHVISEILENVEDYISENQSYLKVKSLLNILTEISNEDLWPHNEVDLIIRLLNCHIRSIETQNSIIHGLEVCIRQILCITTSDILLFTIEYILETYCEIDLPDLDIKKVEFSIQIAATLYKTDQSLITSFKYETLINILTLIASDSVAKCIFGNETFQNILDSNNNITYFRYPKIFFMKIAYKLIPKQVDLNDLDFIKKYRKELHLTFLSSIFKHRHDIKIVQSIYASMCLLMSEVPCEFTAAFLVCLVMNIQKNILANGLISGAESHRLHAVVISVMSLVCWLTDAKMLYIYLEKILKLRAHSAPFLNPPLKPKYIYATHFVLWNKPDLFFENFEVRYALWKRFRLHEKYTEKPPVEESKRAKEKKSIAKPKEAKQSKVSKRDVKTNMSSPIL